MADTGQLTTLLSQTLDPTPGTRAAAEQHLVALSQSSPTHVSSLLQLIAANEAPSQVRLASAIHLKNIIRTRWDNDEAQSAGLPPVDDTTKASLRQNLLPLLLSLSSLDSAAPLPLRLQLNTSLSLVASHDFPRVWTGLLDEIVARLTQADPDLGVVQACLSTLHEVTKSWRGQFRSDSLYEEINFILEKFAPVWWTSIQATNHSLVSPATPASHIQPLFSILHLQTLLFYDLSCQDLPPLFEDNLAQISSLLLHWLSHSPEASRLPPNDDDDKPDELTNVRAAICEAAELYAQRYLDAWEPQVSGFVQAVWEMLGKLEGQSGARYDGLLARALSFLSIIVRSPSLRHLFSQGEGAGGSVMESLVQRVILPNVGMKENEEELFEDEPLAWVRRELEGSTETDTPRLASLAFLRALLEHFTQDITRIVSSYIQAYLEQYTSDPSGQWRKKDAAIWLMTGVAARGTTGRHGVSQSSTNSLVNVVEFFSNHVYSDLQDTTGNASAHPILKVDAIRYLYTFRNQLTKEQLLSVLPLLVQHLRSENTGIATYAAIAIERILVLKTEGANKPMFTPQDVQPFAEPMLVALLTKIEEGGTPERVAENEFLIKCAMRVIATSRDTIAGVVGVVLQHLSSILTTIAKNPSNPRFSQFAFESLAALVRFTTASNPSTVDQFEQALFPPFTEILQADVAEFVPYVFQLLSQMLELRSGAELPSSYQSLLPSLLTPALWQSRGNVPALVRLMQAYLSKAATTMVTNNQIPAVLGIYQNLIASRINDEYGFELMQTVFQHVPESALQPYKGAILTLLLTRLQTTRTEKFTRNFVCFVATLSTLQKPDYPNSVIAAFDAVQPGLFQQLMQGILGPEIPKMPARKRPLVIAGMGRLALEAPGLNGNEALFRPTMSAVLALVTDTSIAKKSIEAQQAEEDEIFVEDWEEQNTFQAGFSKLAASAPAGGMTADALAVQRVVGSSSSSSSNGTGAPAAAAAAATNEINVRHWLVSAMAQFSARQPGQLAPVLASLDPSVAGSVQQWASEQGVQIA